MKQDEKREGECNIDKSGDETRPLPAYGTLRRPYSSRLVGIVTHELLEQTSSPRANRRMRVLIGMLVAAPLWLMIVLLSPLDAIRRGEDLAMQL